MNRQDYNFYADSMWSQKFASYFSSVIDPNDGRSTAILEKWIEIHTPKTLQNYTILT